MKKIMYVLVLFVSTFSSVFGFNISSTDSGKQFLLKNDVSNNFSVSTGLSVLIASSDNNLAFNNVFNITGTNSCNTIPEYNIKNYCRLLFN